MTLTPASGRRGWTALVKRWALLVTFGYLTLVVLMWFLENQLVFHPTTAAQNWEPAPSTAIRDVTFASPAGVPVHGWWLPRAAEAPVLVVFHGNGGNLSHRGRTMLDASDRLGVSVLIFDYPGYGKTPGKPNEAACYDTAEGAVRWLRDEKGVPPERCIFYGESLGGGVAAEMAARYPCRALVLVKSFTSLPAAAKYHYPWLPVGWLMSNRFDTAAKLGRLTCPVAVLGATADRVVPFRQSQDLFAIANEPKWFFTAEGTDHNDALPEAFWGELRGFLKLD
ncbi:MAG TPA: alpha/beta fold hydrolase [Gemmataceae bacterium]|nr:alpha/beta fold hydrolase [Gemmataceae bacterium]